MRLNETTATTPDWRSSLLNFGSQLLTLKQQSDLNKINVQRVSQGLPPVDAGAIAPQVRIGADPAQLRNIGLFAAAGLLALLFIVRRRNR